MLAGDVLLLRMSGVLTARALAGIAGEAIRAHGHEARGFVLDYRAGVLAATADELGGLLAGVQADSPMRRPGAFVGTDETLGVLREHAVRSADAGCWRRTFTQVAPARGWVDRLAQQAPPGERASGP